MEMFKIHATPCRMQIQNVALKTRKSGAISVKLCSILPSSDAFPEYVYIFHTQVSIRERQHLVDILHLIHCNCLANYTAKLFQYIYFEPDFEYVCCLSDILKEF